MKLAALAVLAGMLVAPTVTSPPKTFATHFRVGDHGMLLVDGAANGVPLTFAVDTGADAALIKRRIPLLPGMPVTPTYIVGVGGAQRVLQTKAEICIKGVPCQLVYTMIIDGKKVDASVDNLLPLTYFAQFGRMTIDFEHDVIIFEAREEK